VLLEAELAAESVDIDVMEFADLTSDDNAMLCDAVDKHLLMLVDWARRLPPFAQLTLADQVTLLRSGQHAYLPIMPICLSCLSACHACHAYLPIMPICLSACHAYLPVMPMMPICL